MTRPYDEVMADVAEALDTDEGLEWHGVTTLAELLGEVREHTARFRDIAEWAMDADHHPGCLATHNRPQGTTSPPPAKPYPCKCGRDSLTWEGVR